MLKSKTELKTKNQKQNLENKKSKIYKFKIRTKNLKVFYNLTISKS